MWINDREQKNGFTLLELLVVLSIWSVLLLLVTPLTFTQIDERKEKLFLETLEFDLLFMQRLSTLTKDDVRFGIRKDKYVILQGHNENVVSTREIPAGWKFDMRSLKYIAFDENGRVRQPITIVLTTNRSEFKIVFPLGKGRSYVVKQ